MNPPYVNPVKKAKSYAKRLWLYARDDGDSRNSVSTKCCAHRNATQSPTARQAGCFQEFEGE